MRNTPTIPIVALVVAAIIAIATLIRYLSIDRDADVLTEGQIGLAAWAFALAIYGVQGLVSVLLEGRELHIGRVQPRLTNPLSLAIVAFAVILLTDAVLLGYGIIEDWEPMAIGTLAGVGCLVLALLLIFYKEAFVGDETRFDEREDGVPW